MGLIYMIYAIATNYDTMQLSKCRVRYNGELRFKIKVQNLISLKATHWEFPLNAILLQRQCKCITQKQCKNVRHLSRKPFIELQK